jgi:hypothetical protein
MRTQRPLAVSVAVPLTLILCGCPPKPPPKTIVPMEALVAEFNANAARAPRLWAQAKVAITVYDEKTGLPWTYGSPLLPPNGLVLLGKGGNRLGPHDFVLIVKEAGGVEVARAGCSTVDGLYYFWLNLGQRRQLLYGRTALAGAPGIEGLPIDPLQLMSVLSICELPDDFTKLPTVALSMDYDPEAYAYVLTYVDRQPISDRILFRREMYFIWSDCSPRRPFLIRFFDAQGRPVMSAELEGFQSIDVEEVGAPPRSPPVLPTDIRITWIDPVTGKTRSRLRLILSRMAARDLPYPDACSLRDNLPHGWSLEEGVLLDGDVAVGGRHP